MSKINLDDFRNIQFQIKSNCSVCNTKSGEPLIELPKLPLTEIYTNEPPTKKIGFVDQSFYLCRVCGHGQLGTLIDPKVLYGHTYAFRTSVSTTSAPGNDFFINFINGLINKKKFDNIIEIGCNDLYLLKQMREKANTLIGIDPMLKGKEEEFSDNEIVAIGDFFENVNLDQYKDAENLVLSSHTLEHLENPRSLIQRLFNSISDNSLFIFQFPGLETLVEDFRFDQIFHHHLHYFSLNSFSYLLNELEGELIDYDINRSFWGSLLVAFRKNSDHTNPILEDKTIYPKTILKKFDLFKQEMEFTNNLLESLRGERICGYGAALALPVLAYHLKNDFSSFECIVDDDPNKEGSYYINLPVPIKKTANAGNLKDTNIVITAINNSRQIFPKLIPLNPKRIILPISSV